MGNNHNRAVRFSQSVNDFPLDVTLGNKLPSWELSRWNGDKGLRFVPPDDEGFSLRGDRRQLLYKGKRRSHRFTIHSDTSFEYDCFLLKEPESNVVSLLMNGAEKFDFFRQPDFVRDPFLKGSYAVYKKEILVGQGTGKLCHIHRPLIIDALGRKVWGELSIVGSELRITIPEYWLSLAKYPVIVDPIVGTTTVGSQWQYYNCDYEPDYPDESDEWLQIFFECNIQVCKYLVPETIDGNCTAFYYTVKGWDNNCGVRPVFYSDQNNVPFARRSKNENWIDLDVTSSKPAGWRSGTFASNIPITAGSNIWFGAFMHYFWFFHFDYGGRNYSADYENVNIIPDIFPTRAQWENDYKISMYFSYTSAQNYIRTITQGVSLTDARLIKADYKRVSAQTARINDNRKLNAYYKRDLIQGVNNSAVVKSLFTFFRQCLMSVGNITDISRFPIFSRFVSNEVKNESVIDKKMEINRECTDTIVPLVDFKRSQDFFRSVINNIKTGDDNSCSILFVRSVNETQDITDSLLQWMDYLRYLYVEAGNIAETKRWGDFYRKKTEVVNVDGLALRHLFIFIKLVTTSIVRDFVVRRFLIAREELVLKSSVTKKITLESKIN